MKHEIAMPAPSKEERRYRAEDAMRTIARAEEHKKDKQLMSDVKKHHAVLGAALGATQARSVKMPGADAKRKAPNSPPNPAGSGKGAGAAVKADMNRGTKPSKLSNMTAAKRKERT